MKRKTIRYLFVFAFIFAFMAFPALLKPQKAFAGSPIPPLKLETDQVVLDRVYYDDEEGLIDEVCIDVTSDSCDIASINVPNESKKYISVRIDDTGRSLWVKGKAVGSCTFSVVGDEGQPNPQPKPVTVTVKKEYFNTKLKCQSYVYDHSYGTTKMKLYSWPNSDVKIKIGSDTYLGKIGSGGSGTVKLSKVYKLGSKIYITYVNGEYVAKQTLPVYSATDVDSAKAKKKTIKVVFWNLHKGDIIKLKYKKKIYTKKVTKNYDGKYKAVKFKVKKKVKPKNKFTVKVYNKYKQPHDKVVFKVKKGTTKCKALSGKSYYHYDPD